MNRNKLMAISLLTLMSSSVFAGGYRISMQGQRQLAMGHTGVAVIGQNAESIFFNPANGAFLKDKWSFSVYTNCDDNIAHPGGSCSYV